MPKEFKQRIIGVVLATISFAVYLYACLSLNQGNEAVNRHEFAVERWALSAAISHVVLGGPKGQYYSLVCKEILRNDRSVEENINYVLANGAELKKSLSKPVGDGDGYALPFIYSAGMRAFGPHVKTVILTFCSLLFLSVMAYVLRFSDYRFILAPVSLFSLLLLIFSPLTTCTSVADQVPIGGYRYFSLLAALPVMHIVLELLDNQTKARKLSFICLSIQAILLALCALVGKAAWYALLAIAVFSLAQVYRSRMNPTALKVFRNKLVVATLVAVCFSVTCYAITPRCFKAYGTSTDTFWDRVFISYGVNPNWPYPWVQKYKFRGIPEGMLPGVVDRNAHLVWCDYATRHHMSVYEMLKKVYGTEYESVLRDEVLQIMVQHPQESFITFFYYKPLRMMRELIQPKSYVAPGKGNSIPIALAVSALALVASLFLFCNRQNIASVFRLSYLPLAFVFSTLPMYIVAWGTFVTMADLIFYLHVLAGTTLSASLLLIVSKISPLGSLRGSRRSEVPVIILADQTGPSSSLTEPTSVR